MAHFYEESKISGVAERYSGVFKDLIDNENSGDFLQDFEANIDKIDILGDEEIEDPEGFESFSIINHQD